MFAGKSHKTVPMICAIMAAALFGATAPVAKLFLDGIGPVMLAALFYLGSGTGLLLYILLSGMLGRRRQSIEAAITRKDLPVLIGIMLFGGVFAPVTLMFSLQYVDAATAVLLLTFEPVATTIFAALLFKEWVSRQVWVAMGLIAIACGVLTYDPSAILSFSLAAVGVLLCAIFWATDNNLSRTLSGKDPIVMVCFKGLGAGVISFSLALLIGEHLPSPQIVALSMFVGFFAYGGVTSVLFFYALRGIGAARAGSLLALSPFFGVAIAFLIFREPPTTLFLIAFPVMIAGTALLLAERHSHRHIHPALVHEHRHHHDDGHHDHEHDPEDPLVSRKGEHSHMHVHEKLTHIHPHMPDIHHQHEHLRKNRYSYSLLKRFR